MFVCCNFQESFKLELADDDDDDDDDDNNNEVTSHDSTSALLRTESLINKALHSNAVVTIETLNVDRCGCIFIL